MMLSSHPHLSVSSLNMTKFCLPQVLFQGQNMAQMPSTLPMEHTIRFDISPDSSHWKQTASNCLRKGLKRRWAQLPILSQPQLQEPLVLWKALELGEQNKSKPCQISDFHKQK